MGIMKMQWTTKPGKACHPELFLMMIMKNRGSIFGLIVYTTSLFVANLKSSQTCKDNNAKIPEKSSPRQLRDDCLSQG